MLEIGGVRGGLRGVREVREVREVRGGAENILSDSMREDEVGQGRTRLDLAA